MTEETATIETPSDTAVDSVDSVDSSVESDGFLESTPVSDESVSKDWIYDPGDDSPDQTAELEETPEKQAEEKTEVADGGQAKPTIDEALVAIAVHAGLTRDEAMQFPSTRALYTVLTKMAASRSAPGSQAQTAGESVPQTYQQPEPFRVQLDPEKYEPEIVDQFNAIGSYVQQLEMQLGALTSRAQQEEYARQAEEVQRFDSDLNGWFNSLKDLKEHVGTGEMSDLKFGSKEHSTRLEIVDVYLALRESYRSSGRIPPPEETLKQRALSAVLGDELTKKAERATTERIAAQIRDQKGRFAARASSRPESVSSDPLQRAYDAVRSKMADMGESA